MLWAIGFLDHLHLRWSDRRHPGVAAARLPRLRHLLRRRALPLRGVRHRRVRDVQRASTSGGRSGPARCSTSGSASRTSGCCSSASTRRSSSSTGSASIGMPRRYCELPADRRLHLDEPGLDRRRHDPRRLDDPVPAQRVDHGAQRRRRSRSTTRGATARSLEWATSCPPPRHNFTSIPRIRSESPAFDLNHPEAGVPVGIGPLKDAPDAPGRRPRRRRGEVDVRANANLFWILARLLLARRRALHRVEPRLDPDRSHRTTVEWVGTVGIALSRRPGRAHRLLPRPRRTRRRAASCPRTASTPTSTTATPRSGYFSPWSWWPIMLALGARAGVPRPRGRHLDLRSSACPLAVVAIVGWVYEYYRGNFAR